MKKELEYNSWMRSQYICDLSNMLINSSPYDGPMVKGILHVSLLGIYYLAKSEDVAEEEGLHPCDAERLEWLKKVSSLLFRGRYDILPCYPSTDLDIYTK